jgi:transcriptional regulator with XRE-family HTH domain
MRGVQTVREPHELVAAEVRAEMARQRMSQTRLAEALGVTQASVSRRLVGEVPFDIQELYKVAEFLGVPVAQFLGTSAGAV